MAAVKKTNAVRLLENLKIPFELLEYEIDEEALEIGVAFYAQVAVDALGKLTK